MKKGQFEQYVNLIRKSAHFYAKKWNVDYKEVEAQAFFIYCESLKKYDVTRGSFSTHLTWQLRTLNGFCSDYKYKKNLLIDDCIKTDDPKLNPIDILPARNENITLFEMLQYSKEYLSTEAYKLLAWILGRTWEKKGRLKPSISLVMDTFHYTKKQATSFWNEIGNFYKTTLYAL